MVAQRAQLDGHAVRVALGEGVVAEDEWFHGSRMSSSPKTWAMSESNDAGTAPSTSACCRRAKRYGMPLVDLVGVVGVACFSTKRSSMMMFEVRGASVFTGRDPRLGLAPAPFQLRLRRAGSSCRRR